ncbi:MAG: peptide chain release factor N(5)-glutamine methyltransferase [Oligoflexales bacterium]
MHSSLWHYLANLQAPTILEVYQATKTCKGDVREDLKRDYVWLACSFFNMSQAQMLTGRPRPIEKLEFQKFLQVASRLIGGEPLALILGWQEFLGRKFKVSQDVLIPRPETETLVNTVQEAISENPHWSAGLDIGTGSGCIAVSLALSSSQIAWHAWDISDQALAIARENAGQLGARVSFDRQNILSGPIWLGPKLDVVVSNPPYIALEEKDDLSPSVVEFEPHIALFAPSEDPLRFYDKIGSWAYELLSVGGELFFETHYKFADDVAEKLSQLGYVKVRVRKDLFGNDRIVTATKNR